LSVLELILLWPSPAPGLKLAQQAPQRLSVLLEFRWNPRPSPALGLKLIPNFCSTMSTLRALLANARSATTSQHKAHR
jgi:hypothetical protein